MRHLVTKHLRGVQNFFSEHRAGVNFDQLARGDPCRRLGLARLLGVTEVFINVMHRLAAGDLDAKPGPRIRPVAIGRGYRQAENLGRLADRQAREDAKLDELALDPFDLS